jgi:hypothetical protein
VQNQTDKQQTLRESNDSLALLERITSHFIGDEQEYTVIGVALLFGTIANELIGRRR